MDCWSIINPPCVNIDINHIRFITNKWGRITFVCKPFLEFGAFLLHVSLLFTEETLGIFLNTTLGRYFAFSLQFGLIFALSMRCQHCTFTLFHHQSPFLLNTHGHEFINWPFILMCVVRDFEGSILMRECVQDVVH